MEPTIDTGDGYLLVPAGDVSAGDVVTFRSPSQDGYVTHRVVESTDRGFVTKGDNNPTADQDAGYEHVTRDRIVGEVFSVGGSPVTIPGFGTVVSTLRDHATVVLGALALAFGASALLRGDSPRRRRSVARVSDVLPPLFAVAFLTAVGLMIVGEYGHTVEYVATASGSSAPNVVAVGETHTSTVDVRHSGSPLTTAVVGVRGAELLNRSGNDTAATATIRVPPQSEVGSFTVDLTVSRYPSVLPEPTLRQLHAVDRRVPAVVTGAMVVAPFVALYLLTIDGRTPLRPSRRRWLRRLLEGDP